MKSDAMHLYHRRFTLSLVVLTLLLAPGAFAHTHAVEMSPAADSTVNAPAKITVKFNGALEPKFSSITVTDATGHAVTKEASICSADKLSMTLAVPPLAPGVYTVKWVGVSADTHRAEGSYKFTVK